MRISDWSSDVCSSDLAFGFASGRYGQDPADGLLLDGCRITNAVRCVPPQNKPSGSEIGACRSFLQFEMAAMTNLEIVLALGAIAHAAVVRVLGLKTRAYKDRKRPRLNSSH